MPRAFVDTFCFSVSCISLSSMQCLCLTAHSSSAKKEESQEKATEGEVESDSQNDAHDAQLSMMMPPAAL